jgi:hypothetical protein
MSRGGWYVVRRIETITHPQSGRDTQFDSGCSSIGGFCQVLELRPATPILSAAGRSHAVMRRNRRLASSGYEDNGHLIAPAHRCSESSVA